MSTLSFEKARYHQTKKRRHQKQQDRLANILKLDEMNQPEALVKAWPQKLPQLVRRQLDRFVLEEWQALKETHQKMAFYKNHPFALPEFIKYDLPYLGEIGRKYHQEIIQQFLNMFESLRGKKTITCNFSVVDPMEGIFTTMAPFIYLNRRFQIDEHNNVLNDQGKPDQKWFEYVVGFSMGGMASMVIRQELSIKYQTKNKQGETLWEHQNRIFGVRFEMDNIVGLSSTQMQESYNVDHDTHLPLPTPTGTSFGDARAMVKQFLQPSAPTLKVIRSSGF